ncbi:aspartyl protease family protein [Flavobacteriaceae bacterium M23B6Z8]
MYKRFLVVVFITITTISVKAQNQGLEITTIPFNLLKNNYVFVKCVVNKKDSLTFYFDTGATSSLIDKSTAKKLGIQPNHEQEVSGASGKVKYQIALNQEITIGGITVDGVHLVMEDLTRLKESMNQPFDGIIGYSLIKEFLTELDFDNQVIKLYPKNSSMDLSSFSQHSFSFDNGIPIPQLDIEIELKNSKKYKGKVLFDSGAGLTLLVNTPFKTENDLVEQTDKILTSSSDNLSGKSISQDIGIKSLSLGKYYFSDLTIGLASDESGVSSYDGYLGILGAEIINRFNIVLDYDNLKMYLKPNSLYDESFDFPITGFSLDKNEAGKIYISKIAKECPAYKKGIRKGDIVISINKNSNNNLAEYKELLKKEGSKIKILIQNGEGKKRYKIRLEKLL